MIKFAHLDGAFSEFFASAVEGQSLQQKDKTRGKKKERQKKKTLKKRKPSDVGHLLKIFISAHAQAKVS